MAINTKSSVALREQLFGLSYGDPDETFWPYEELGRGAFGKVVKASDVKRERRVAIKLVTCDTTQSMKLTLNEVNSMKESSSHPNMVSFYGLYHVSHTAWIVMECIEGVNAQELVRTMDLWPAQIAYITREVLKALDFLHSELDTIHRDVKPANILMSFDGNVKLADLGLSIKASEEKGLGVGTLAYMAPAVLRDPGYTHHVDIWSLGMTIFTLAERMLPYKGLCHTRSELCQVVRENLYTPELSRCTYKMALFYKCCTKYYDCAPASQRLHHAWLDTAVAKTDISSAVREAFFGTGISNEKYINYMADKTLPKVR